MTQNDPTQRQTGLGERREEVKPENETRNTNKRTHVIMYDPTYPPANAEIESAPLRSQFNALKALIDAIQTLAAAQVGTVTTLPPGSPAAVSVSVSGNTLTLSFQIPEGQPGPAGTPAPRER